MSVNRSKKRKSRRRWGLRQFAFWLWLSGLTSLVLFYSAPTDYDLLVGDVAGQNIHAPRDTTYVSEILTRQARENAARQVDPIYTTPDSAIAREQYTRARAVLSFLRAVRADSLGSESQRSAWIWAVPELADLPQTSVQAVLLLPDASWNRVQIEFLDLLDQVMRQEEIRERDLDQIRSRIPAMVSLDMAQDEALLVRDLVVRFVRPNVFYDDAATQAAEQAAREAVGPVPQVFRGGQVIVREGTVISELDLEALSELRLNTTDQTPTDIGSTVVFAVLAILALGFYLHRLAPEVLDGGRQELILALVLSLFLGLAGLLLRAGDLLPYLYPGPAAAMLLATTVGPVPALGVTVLLSGVSGWIAARSLSIGTMLFLGGLFAVLALPRYEQTGPLFRSGLLAGLVEALVILIFSIDALTVAPVSLLLKMGMSIIGGAIAGGLTVGGLFVLTPIFDLTTTFRLMELSRPTQPLLQRLLREAPATFNHVMMVASLSEQAAERIGANGLLTRVGAYYHDIGKLARPYFFIENQQGVSNPHDRLDAYTSVDVLAGHVRDGLKMARQYRLPGKVRAFIPEHHGTMRVSFLYQKAVEAAGGEADLVDEANFRYPGPKPQSRETLLVMLADSSEAATRARRPSTPEELLDVVTMIFDQRMREGQMDECPITMEELALVKQVYVELLRGAFHPRVQYPSQKKASASPAGGVPQTGSASQTGSAPQTESKAEVVAMLPGDGEGAGANGDDDVTEPVRVDAGREPTMTLTETLTEEGE